MRWALRAERTEWTDGPSRNRAPMRADRRAHILTARRLARPLLLLAVLVGVAGLGLFLVPDAASRAAWAETQAPAQFAVWRSPQFSLSLSYPTTWTIVEERSDPVRGDVLIIGNETSALLVGLLHDTRTPREMADDLVLSQKAQTPDLAVVQSEVTATGSILMFLQYTIRPGTDAAMLIDEKALVGTLQPGSSTITLRGMVPDHADVEAEFEELELIIGTLGPDG